MIKPSRRFQFSQFFKYIRLQNFLLYGFYSFHLIAAIKLDAGEYAKAEESALSLDRDSNSQR
jgi:hypothetical protein